MNERIPTTSDERSKLDDTLPFENGFMHIEADIANLISDIRQRALEYGVPANNIEEILGRTEFDIGPITQEDAALVGYGEILGIMQPGDDKCRVRMDVHRLARIAQEGSKLLQAPWQPRIPAGVPLEGKLMIMRSLVNSIWIHETTHLIQYMDPENWKELQNDRKAVGYALEAETYRDFAKLAGIEIAAATVTQVAAHNNFDTLAQGTGALGLATLVGGAVYLFARSDARENQSYLTPRVEAEAFSAGDKAFNDPAIRTLFKLTYEADNPATLPDVSLKNSFRTKY